MAGLAIGVDLAFGSLLERTLSQKVQVANDLSAAAWGEVADFLGTAVANATTLLNPARVILGGGVLLGCEQLYRLVRERFDAQVSASAAVGLSFERAHLGDDAGVIGAALLDG